MSARPGWWGTKSSNRRQDGYGGFDHYNHHSRGQLVRVSGLGEGAGIRWGVICGFAASGWPQKVQAHIDYLDEVGPDGKRADYTTRPAYWVPADYLLVGQLHRAASEIKVSRELPAVSIPGMPGEAFRLEIGRDRGMWFTTRNVSVRPVLWAAEALAYTFDMRPGSADRDAVVAVVAYLGWRDEPVHPSSGSHHVTETLRRGIAVCDATYAEAL